MLVRFFPLLGSRTSSFPGGNTMLGSTHIHRLGSKSGPVQRKRRLRAMGHGLWVSRPGHRAMSENSLPSTHHLYQGWVFFPEVVLVAQLFGVYIWQLAKRKEESQNNLGFSFRPLEASLGGGYGPCLRSYDAIFYWFPLTSLTFSFSSAFFSSHPTLRPLNPLINACYFSQSPSINSRLTNLYL